MRGVDIGAKCRGVSRALGLDVEHDPVLRIFRASDPVLERTFTSSYNNLFQVEFALDTLHEDIYHARGNEAHRRQKGQCCFCGKSIKAFETDHIESRGAHGRNDRLENLRTCCTGLGGCGGHRIRHGG